MGWATTGWPKVRAGLPPCPPGPERLTDRARPGLAADRLSARGVAHRRSCDRADQTGFVGIADGLGAIAGARLGEDPVDVGFHGGVADVKALRDLGVAEAGREPVEHFGFAGGEPAGRVRSTCVWASGMRLGVV